MTPKEARALRDEIKAAGIHCTIPRGGSLPRIVTSDMGEVTFATRDEWLAHLEMRERQRKEREARERLLSRPRNPIDMLIDRACGLE